MAQSSSPSSRRPDPALDRFGLLLVLTATTVAVLSLVDLRPASGDGSTVLTNLAVTLVVAGTMLLALRASGVGRNVRRGLHWALATVVVLALGSSILELSIESFTGVAESPPLFWLVLSIAAPVVVVRRLVHHDRVGPATLAGGLSAYLLIALTFTFAFLTVEALGSGSFFGTVEPTTSFMYFSLVTITTVGYGGLEAAAPFGQLLSMVEAILGQVYLVTVVGMIVGLLIQNRQQNETP